MSWKLILWSISAIIWWGFVIWYIFISKQKEESGKYALRIPHSWSSTFYELKERYGKNKGYILLGTEFGYALPLIPIIIERSPLIALIAVLIVFTATAANYRDNNVAYSVHMTASISSVIAATILFGIIYHLWIFAIPFAILTALVYSEKIKIKNSITWIETATMLAGHIIILVKDVL